VVVLGVFALLVTLYSFVSKRLEGTPITAPMVFVAAGVVAAATGEIHFGIEVSGGISSGGVEEAGVEIVNKALLSAAEIALALVLFTDAARLDVRKLRRSAALPGRLLGIGLPLTLVFMAGVGLGLLDELLFWEAFLLAAILTPTDAALGESVVTSRKLPARIRQALNIESGLNDGIIVPLFTIFLALAAAHEDLTPQSALRVIVEKIGYGLLVGVAVGVIGGLLFTWASKRGWMTKVFQQLGIVSMAVFAFWVAEEIGGSGFIAAFVGGLTIAYVTREISEKIIDLTEDMGHLLGMFVFFVFGALVFELLDLATWQIVLFSVLALTVVRMIPVAISLIGTGFRTDSVLFLGWFGPRGLASIILAMIVIDDEPLLSGNRTIMVAMTVTVLMSVYAHGMTAAPLTRLYARRIEGLGKERPEMKDVAELPTRRQTHLRS
jgi:NhaP-type Na+/H+ or K+/H+ antiporter